MKSLFTGRTELNWLRNSGFRRRQLNDFQLLKDDCFMGLINVVVHSMFRALFVVMS